MSGRGAAMPARLALFGLALVIGGVWLGGAFARRAQAGEPGGMVTMGFALGSATELPTPQLLASIAGSAAAARVQLLGIASDPAYAMGPRLRAIASLRAYSAVSVRDEMRAILDQYRSQTVISAQDVWLVRAALDTLATCGDEQDLARMTYWLERDDLRDVRARAAWALGRLGLPAGIEALRKRLLRETVGQVSYQISEALEELNP